MSADPVSPRLLRIPEVARVLAVGRTTVYGLIASGELIQVHVGRAVRVTAESVDQFVRRLADATDAEKREWAYRG